MNKIRFLLLSIFCVVFLSPGASSAAETVYNFKITSGTVAMTPARNPYQLVPVKEKLMGDFSVKLDAGKIQFFNVKMATPSDALVSFLKTAGDYKNGTIYAAPHTESYDNGYQGYFNGEEISIKGAIDNRPFDGSLVEYSFIAKRLISDVALYQQGYFKIRQDNRKCASPLCGGAFVRQVNKNNTRCADRIYRAECYVAKVDWSSIGVPPSVSQNDVLLYGWIVPKKHKDFGLFGEFKVGSAYESATNSDVKGKTFVGLKNNGIVCIVAPCFFANEYVLNGTSTLAISGINLDQVKASKKRRSVANDILANKELLLAEGGNRKDKGAAGQGLTFIAEQFYLPIPSCGEGYQAKDGQCETPSGCVAPQLEQRTYGGAAFVDPVTGETKSNISMSCVDACDPPGALESPGLCNIYAP
ncbi:conserved exported hypothetical protein [Crenothrix polyspora]|uniref:DUF6748 domain-containing protein n=1 Tax=Crenothrix polyspora TaxID=360316 RepID=A0A1R4H702_9GAMM|nr:DUF6748 domain-containing protein [Crenothrix polyspora]SJM91937.1 conserved exported hypothetical protein [Crenothrix polyspora]